jgi:hypothetical protein
MGTPLNRQKLPPVTRDRPAELRAERIARALGDPAGRQSADRQGYRNKPAATSAGDV